MRRAVAGLLGCLLVACDDDSAPLEPLRELPHSVATNSCGPADGPVIVIYMASMRIEALQPSAPFIEVHIPKSFDEVKGVFPVSENLSDANAWFRGSGVQRTASGGEVGVTATTATTITGYIDLRFPDGADMRGTFSATWEPRLMLCG